MNRRHTLQGGDGSRTRKQSAERQLEEPKQQRQVGRRLLLDLASVLLLHLVQSPLPL